MWRILLVLSIVSFPLAVPVPQKGGANLDSSTTKLLELETQTSAAVADQNSGGDLNSSNSKNISKLLKDCECVPYYRCKSSLNDEQRLANRSALYECPQVLDVCCKPSNTLPSSTIIKRACGKRHSDGVGFEITDDTGDTAKFGEFPWTVSIAIANKNNSRIHHRCGGSLIHKQAVLTAAQCMRGVEPSELRIGIGEWDLLTNNTSFPRQNRNVRDVIIHEKFSLIPTIYDYAILILSDPVNLALHVDVVCLPERETVFDNLRCYASGWGSNKYAQKLQTTMQKLDLPIMSHDVCQNRFRSIGKNIVLHESFICAGGEGKDTCGGFAGSPLICPSKNNPKTYLQAGIVSWGIGCGLDKIPGVYSDVAFARDWIDEQMTLHNLDTTSYQPST